jgi:hypothetical protein
MPEQYCSSEEIPDVAIERMAFLEAWPATALPTDVLLRPGF